MATAKPLDDITKCPICTEVYTDPRVLPCVHTYCLKCIGAWSKDKQPGDRLACPLCRKEFTLPDNGVRGLTKNFFVANFLEMKELLSVKSRRSLCEACSGGGGEKSRSEVQNVAAVYCVECQMKLCRNCERVHRAMKLRRSHKVVEIGEKISVETVYRSMPPSYCDRHPDNGVEIYCLECKVAICMMCYIEFHNNHKFSNIKNIDGDFRNQMASDVDKVAAGVGKCREMLQRIEKEKNDFSKQVTKTGVEISEKAEQLKRMIDVHREKLMNKLSSMKQKRINEIESLREEIERQLLSMESYKNYVDEMRQKGTACDIARAASGLHDRADELLMFDVIERKLADLGHAYATFTSSNFVDDVNKTLGQLRLNEVKGGELV